MAAPALAFLPPGDIQESISKIIISRRILSMINGNCEPLRAHKHWTLKPPSKPSAPLFSSLERAQRIVEDGDRTKNQIEGFHREFQPLIGAQDQRFSFHRGSSQVADVKRDRGAKAHRRT